MIGRVLVIILEAVSVIFIASIFSPESKGYISLVMVLVAYAHQIGELGIYESAVYYVSKKQNKEVSIPNILGLGNLVSGVISILIFICFILIDAYKLIDISLGTIIFCSIILFFLSISNIHYHILIGQKKIIQYVCAKLIQTFIFLISNYLLWTILETYQIFHVFFAYLLSNFLIFIFLSALHIKNRTNIALNLSWNASKDILKFSLKGHPGRILWNLNNKLDFLIINFFLGTSAVGIYSISVTIAECLTFFASSIGSILLPYVAASSKLETLKFSNMIIRHTAILTSLFAILLALIGPLFIVFAFNDQYHGAVLPFLYLIPGTFALAIARVISSHLVGIGRPELQSYGVAVAFLIMIILNFILIPKLGIIGAAISSSIAYIFETIIISYFYLKATKQKLSKLLYFSINDIYLYANFIRQRSFKL
ncbi:MAG: hypothetical protein CBB97_19330 [Candidatus Endolissoclinum sp. TMED37]|nr:MAG: hypothetical protein CBB97_19330 [Candidatus Endolissoclinum sp. TMED37]